MGRFPGFDFQKLLTGDTTDMTSYFKNANPDNVDAIYDYNKKLESWSSAEVYAWAKYTLPMDCLPTFKNLNLNGRILLTRVSKTFIKNILKIDEEAIQDIILEEIKVLEKIVNSNVNFQEETNENGNNGEMNEDELHTIKQTFINLKAHTDRTMETIDENVHKMQSLFSSKSLYHHTIRQIQEMYIIVQSAAYHIDILENALDKTREEKLKNSEEMKTLEEKLTALAEEKDYAFKELQKSTDLEKEQLIQKNSEEMEIWQKKLTALAEEKDYAFKE